MIAVFNGNVRSFGTYSVTAARFRMRVPLVRTRSRILPRLGWFVPLGPTQSVRFRVEHGVQRLFRRAANHFS
jgi:hypothetical protein